MFEYSKIIQTNSFCNETLKYYKLCKSRGNINKKNFMTRQNTKEYEIKVKLIKCTITNTIFFHFYMMTRTCPVSILTLKIIFRFKYEYNLSYFNIFCIFFQCMLCCYFYFYILVLTIFAKTGYNFEYNGILIKGKY